MSLASPPDLGELTLERETRDSEPRDFSPPRRATNPFKICMPIPAAEEPLKYKFGLELDWKQSCSYRKRPRGGRRCLQCEGFWVAGTAGASRAFPAGLIPAGRARLGSGPERLAERSRARTPSSWAAPATCLECLARLCLKPPPPARPSPQPLKSPSPPPPPPSPHRIYLCQWTVLVTLKLWSTFSRTFISGSFMTLCESAKFLIRLARQPEAAAAPQSLHSLSALQHNKPLYSFEDNADYVYDVMWSPVHPALFACVDGLGRLDLWNLNNDTEVSGGAGAGPAGRAGRGAPSASLRLPLSLKWPFLDRPSNCSLVADPPFSAAVQGIGRCVGPKSFNLTSSLNRGGILDN